MAVNILVVEDESIVRKDIERSLVKLGYQVVAQADNGEKAIELARSTKPDLALMDIQIKGDMTGIETAEVIKGELDIPVIYLTAFADDATLSKAKLTEPHGYILKPFKEVDLHTTIEMAIHKHSREREIKVENELLKSLTNYKTNAEYLFIKHNSRLVKVNASDIYYVEALKDYMQIVTADMRYIIHATMKDMEKKLPKTVFQRIHRSYMVNMSKIYAISGSDIILNDINKEIPVGGNYRDEFSERINVL
ncbi:MAG: LytR/AlgR family response regulator transcription factor [Flavobacteriales bacterium]